MWTLLSQIQCWVLPQTSCGTWNRRKEPPLAARALKTSEIPLGPVLWPQQLHRAELQANTTRVEGQALQIQSFTVLAIPPLPPQQSAILLVNSDVRLHANRQRDVASLPLRVKTFWTAFHQFISVQFSHSVVSDFVIPWTAAHQASLSITNSQSLLKLMSIDLVMPSNHLILCHPLLLMPSIFPSIRVFSKESVLPIRWPKYWSISFSISPSNEYAGLISFRMDWLDLLAVQGTLKSLLQHHSRKASKALHSLPFPEGSLAWLDDTCLKAVHRALVQFHQGQCSLPQEANQSEKQKKTVPGFRLKAPRGADGWE